MKTVTYVVERRVGSTKLGTRTLKTLKEASEVKGQMIKIYGPCHHGLMTVSITKVTKEVL
jgi:hypothetical protein